MHAHIIGTLTLAITTTVALSVGQIKMIRILTVIAYLVSVSMVAASLSAYYVFIWNPYAGNNTQTPNTEGMAMALHRAGGQYVYADTVAADRRYLGKHLLRVAGKLSAGECFDNGRPSPPSGDGFVCGLRASEQWFSTGATRNSRGNQ